MSESRGSPEPVFVPDFDELHTASEVHQHTQAPLGPPPTNVREVLAERIAVETGRPRAEIVRMLEGEIDDEGHIADGRTA